MAAHCAYPTFGRTDDRNIFAFDDGFDGDHKLFRHISDKRASSAKRLEQQILPLYAHRRADYLAVMRSTIVLNGSHFNAQRMLAEYAIDAYEPGAHAKSGVRPEQLVAV